jgi:hypothetical protein
MRSRRARPGNLRRDSAVARTRKPDQADPAHSRPGAAVSLRTSIGSYPRSRIASVRSAHDRAVIRVRTRVPGVIRQLDDPVLGTPFAVSSCSGCARHRSGARGGPMRNREREVRTGGLPGSGQLRARYTFGAATRPMNRSRHIDLAAGPTRGGQDRCELACLMFRALASVTGSRPPTTATVRPAACSTGRHWPRSRPGLRWRPPRG